jgi:hypothetical protein
MSNTIQIKRSSTSGSVPTTAQLAQGELAVNLADKKLYTKDSTNSVVEITPTNATNLTGTSTSNIQSSALASGTASSSTFLRGDRTWQTISTTPTTDQVLTATAGASYAAVGVYTIASNGSGSSTSNGATVAGSSLTGFQPSTAAYINAGLAGTWRNMGGDLRDNSSGNVGRTQFWLRIS